MNHVFEEVSWNKMELFNHHPLCVLIMLKTGDERTLPFKVAHHILSFSAESSRPVSLSANISDLIRLSAIAYISAMLKFAAKQAVIKPSNTMNTARITWSTQGLRPTIPSIMKTGNTTIT